MIIAGFAISYSTRQTQWFEDTFFIPEILQQIVLSMPFLKLGNRNVSWTVRTMHLRQWEAEIVVMTTNRVDLIEPEDFIQQMVEEFTPTYVCHVIMIQSFSF